MKYKIFGLFILCSINIYSAFSDVKKLTMSEFIINACKNSFFEEILMEQTSLSFKESLKIPVESLIIKLSEEYSLNLGLNFDHSKESANEIIGTNFSTGFATGMITLSKLFPYTGTSVNFSYRTNVLLGYKEAIDNENREYTFSGSVTPSAAFRLEQDIVKNSFGKIAGIERDIAGIERSIAEYQIIESYEAYLITLYELYFNWYSNFMSYNNQKKALEDSRTLHDITLQKAKYGIAGESELIKSNLDIENNKERFLKQEAAYLEIKNQIIDTMQTDLTNDIKPDFIPDFSFDSNEMKSIINDFKTGSRTVKIMELTKNKNKKNLDILYDELLPDGNLYFSTNLSNKNTLDTDNTKTAIDSSLSLGFSMSFNFDNSYAKARYELQKQTNKITGLSDKNKLIEIEKTLNIYFQKMELLKKMIEISNNKVKYAERILELELKDYNNGLATLENVISAYQSLYSNRLSNTGYIIEYYLYYLRFLTKTDSLVTDKQAAVLSSNK